MFKIMKTVQFCQNFIRGEGKAAYSGRVQWYTHPKKCASNYRSKFEKFNVVYIFPNSKIT